MTKKLHSPSLLLVIAAALAVLALAFVALRSSDAPPDSPPFDSPPIPAGPLPAHRNPAVQRAPDAPAHAAAPAASASPAPAGRGVLAELAWGQGPGRIGMPRLSEGEATAPLRVSADEAGRLLLVDRENRRLVRFGADGSAAGSIPLQFGRALDVDVARDGTLAVLDTDSPPRVKLLGPDGQVRAELPVHGEGLESAEAVRGVSVVGDDVFVEGQGGEVLRVGDVDGGADPAPAPAPGLPTRDGRGYLGVNLVDGASGALHVYLLEGEPAQQRFSRMLHLPMAVEGVQFLETNRSGTIYLGLVGSLPTPSGPQHHFHLACLEPETGRLLGMVELPVTPPNESIVDATALDAGGVAYSVWSERGVRLEHRDCQ